MLRAWRKEKAMARARRRTLLTVDTGPERTEPTRFYRLVVAGGSDTEPVREDLLVPDGDELRTRHSTLDDAA
jgi:hypothetical protein